MTYKVIQFWNQQTLPPDIAQLRDTWKQHNPHAELLLFNAQTAAEFIQQEYGAHEAGLFNGAALPAMQSDIFRVAYCLARGGFYIDAGTECSAAVTDLLPDNDELVLMRKWHGGIWNGMISCKAGSPALNAIWQRILDNLEQRPSNDVWKLTGPASFNQIVDGGEYDDVIRVIEQKQVKAFRVVNELEHKKQHWSKVQKTQSVFTGGAAPDANPASDNVAAPEAVVATRPQSVSEPTHGVSLHLTDGHEKDSGARVFVEVTGFKSQGNSYKPFPLAINWDSTGVSLEFYSPDRQPHIPLQLFIASGRNSLCNFMRITQHGVVCGDTVSGLTSHDREVVKDLISALQAGLSGAGLSDKAQTAGLSPEQWQARLADQSWALPAIAASSERVSFRKLSLGAHTSSGSRSVLAIHAEATKLRDIQIGDIEVTFHADVDSANALQVTHIEIGPLNTNLEAPIEFTRAVIDKLHMMDLKGDKLSNPLAFWYGAAKAKVNSLT